MTTRLISETQPKEPEYEFTDEQERIIADLAKKMRLVGQVTIIFGVIGTIGGISLITQGGLAGLIQGVISVMLGVWTIRASNSFNCVVRTQGRDIQYLMDALVNLRKYYGLKYAIILCGVLLLVAVLVVLLLAVVFGIGVMLMR